MIRMYTYTLFRLFKILQDVTSHKSNFFAKSDAWKGFKSFERIYETARVWALKTFAAASSSGWIVQIALMYYSATTAAKCRLKLEPQKNNLKEAFELRGSETVVYSSGRSGCKIGLNSTCDLVDYDP
jgi:hypothetical protein